MDRNKGITKITYNHLNLPLVVTFGGGNKIEYIYTGNGTRVGKRVTQNGVLAPTDYMGGFQYKGDTLEFFPTAEGYVDATGGQNSYVFHYRDHLGNIRLGYTQPKPGEPLVIMEEHHYYPFGMKHANYNDPVHNYIENPDGTGYADVAQVAQSKYRYRFNGQEWQDELGLNMTAMDYRPYDNALGRFHSVDALAEWMPDMTPYRFGFNNPVAWNDPSGLFESIAAARAYMSALGYSNNEYYISPDSSGNYIAYYHGQAFSGAIDADTFLGGELNTVTVGGGGGGGFLGTGFSTSEVLDVATDFMPGSGLKDIYKGWRDGNGWVIAMGVGFVVFDVLTMGGGSVIRGTIKTIGKRLMKNTARNAIKEVEEQVVKEVVAKGVSYSDDLVKAAQELYPKKAGKIELHHPTPQYLGGAKDQILVPLDGAYHQVITNEFRAIRPYGLGPVNEAQRLQIMEDVYSKFPLPPGYGF